MTIRTFPLDNVDFSASDVSLYFSNRTSGVYSANGELETISNNDMTVTVKKGRAWLHISEFIGMAVGSYNDETIGVEIADGVLNRIDRVVLKYDVLANNSQIYVKRGTPNSNPTPPPLTRDVNTAYEIGLATIFVGKGVTQIRPQDITDTRLDKSVCGLISDGVESIPTDGLYNQFNDWFDHVKGQLTTDVAGNLQTQIDVFNDLKANGGTIADIRIPSDNEQVAKIETDKQLLGLYNKDSGFILGSNVIHPASMSQGKMILGSIEFPFKDIYVGVVSRGITKGYTKDVNGLMHQWGYIDIPANTEKIAVQYALTFPNNCLNVQVTNHYLSSGAIIYSTQSISKSDFYVLPRTSNSVSVPTVTTRMYWYAIGY